MPLRGTTKLRGTMKRHPLERIVRLLACKLTGHRYGVAREFGRSRKVTCSRCGAAWAMHDDTRSFLPWDDDFEQLYAPGGVLHEKASGRTAACQGPVAPRHEPAQAMAHCSSAGGESTHLQPNG